MRVVQEREDESLKEENGRDGWRQTQSGDTFRGKVARTSSLTARRSKKVEEGTNLMLLDHVLEGFQGLSIF